MKMKIESVPIDSVTQLENNPRKHSTKQMEEMGKSITMFGQYRPLVVDGDGVILAGNGLHTALKALGHETVNIYRMAHLTPAERAKLVLADNRLGAMSFDDFDAMDAMLRELDDFEIPGFDPDMLQDLLGDLEQVMDTADDFGVLDDVQIVKLQAREEGIAEADSGMTTGTLPDTPAVRGTPVTEVDPEVIEAAANSENPTICPTCRRKW